MSIVNYPASKKQICSPGYYRQLRQQLDKDIVLYTRVATGTGGPYSPLDSRSAFIKSNDEAGKRCARWTPPRYELHFPACGIPVPILSVKPFIRRGLREVIER